LAGQEALPSVLSLVFPAKNLTFKEKPTPNQIKLKLNAYWGTHGLSVRAFWYFNKSPAGDSESTTVSGHSAN